MSFDPKFLARLTDYALCCLAANIDEQAEDDLMKGMDSPGEMSCEQFIAEACREAQYRVEHANPELWSDCLADVSEG